MRRSFTSSSSPDKVNFVLRDIGSVPSRPFFRLTEMFATGFCTWPETIAFPESSPVSAKVLTRVIGTAS